MKPPRRQPPGDRRAVVLSALASCEALHRGGYASFREVMNALWLRGQKEYRGVVIGLLDELVAMGKVETAQRGRFTVFRRVI